MKRKFKFENYKKYLKKDEIILRTQQRFESEAHKVCTEKFNKIALTFNDDKKLKSFDRVKPYQCGTTNVRKAGKENLLKYVKTKKLNMKDD